MELRLEHNLGKAWCNDTGLFGTPDQGFWVSGIMQWNEERIKEFKSND